MAKVVGTIPPLTTGCSKCKSIVEYYEPDDIKIRPKSDNADWQRYIVCPNCSNKITVINKLDEMCFIYKLNTYNIRRDEE